jgi:hypothetical protein
VWRFHEKWFTEKGWIPGLFEHSMPCFQMVPRNCRSLGFARDDKGKGNRHMESGCWNKEPKVLFEFNLDRCEAQSSLRDLFCIR